MNIFQRVYRIRIWFFFTNPHTGRMKARNPVLGAHFLPYQWFYWTDCFQKKKNWFTHVWTRTNHVNLMKISSIIINGKSRNVIFYCKLKNIHQVLLLKSILIRKKILWRVNFVLIKLSLNVLLFEKSWNECKNPSFLHKAICIESDHGSTKMGCCLSTSWLYTLGDFGLGTENHSKYLNSVIFQKFRKTFEVFLAYFFGTGIN